MKGKRKFFEWEGYLFMNITMILMMVLSVLLYGAISFYIGYNGWVWLKAAKLGKYKKWYIALVVLLSLSMFLGQIGALSWFTYAGYAWMVIVGYSLVLLPLFNLLSYILKKKGIFWMGISYFAFFLFVFVYGSYNAWSPVVREYEVTVDKESKTGDLKVLLVSDLHLSEIVGEDHLARLVKKVEEIEPDIVMIAGDVINDNIDAYMEEDMGQTMKKITAPLGVYAIPGNHDYYGDDLEKMVKEMDKAGIKVLMDETVTVADSFYVSGRNDLTDEYRVAVSELVKGLDRSKPLFMMDHTPVELDEGKENGVDIMLSGHTHRGQLAPANLITSLIYENDWGHLQKGDFHSFVSSGFGTWGPPLRIGSRSEVMVIDVHFKK